VYLVETTVVEVLVACLFCDASRRSWRALVPRLRRRRWRTGEVRGWRHRGPAASRGRL